MFDFIMTDMIILSDSELTGEIFQLTEIDFIYVYGVSTIVQIFYKSITGTGPDFYADMNFIHWN